VSTGIQVGAAYEDNVLARLIHKKSRPDYLGAGKVGDCGLCHGRRRNDSRRKGTKKVKESLSMRSQTTSGNPPFIDEK